MQLELPRPQQQDPNITQVCRQRVRRKQGRKGARGAGRPRGARVPDGPQQAPRPRPRQSGPLSSSASKRPLPIVAAMIMTAALQLTPSVSSRPRPRSAAAPRPRRQQGRPLQLLLLPVRRAPRNNSAFGRQQSPQSAGAPRQTRLPARRVRPRARWQEAPAVRRLKAAASPLQSCQHRRSPLRGLRRSPLPQ